MDGRLFHTSANFLLNNGQNEADYRSAISRAYYACFLVTRMIAFTNCDLQVRRIAGLTKERNIRHKVLSGYLKNSSDTTLKSLGQDLAGLYGNRVDADYNMSGSISCDDAKGAVEDANCYLTSISQITPSLIGEAMEKYIKATFVTHKK